MTRLPGLCKNLQTQLSQKAASQSVKIDCLYYELNNIMTTSRLRKVRLCTLSDPLPTTLLPPPSLQAYLPGGRKFRKIAATKAENFVLLFLVCKS